MCVRWKILYIALCMLLIFSCSFSYQKYARVAIKVENAMVVFSSIDSLSKEAGMILQKRESDGSGETILAYEDAIDIRERRVWVGVLREKIDEDGFATYLITCGFEGPEENTAKERVNKLFNRILSIIEKLEDDGVLTIKEMN